MSPPRFAVAVAVALLAACRAPGATPVGWDAGGQNCVENSPPLIGNLELDSFLPSDPEEDPIWTLLVRFDWLDPGVDGASDPPNMIGGYLSFEVGGFDAPSSWLMEPAIQAGATSGQLEQLYQQDVWAEGQVLDFELRVRDRCGATSNEKAGTYTLGQGLAVEGGGEATPAEGT